LVGACLGGVERVEFESVIDGLGALVPSADAARRCP